MCVPFTLIYRCPRCASHDPGTPEPNVIVVRPGQLDPVRGGNNYAGSICSWRYTGDSRVIIPTECPSLRVAPDTIGVNNVGNPTPAIELREWWCPAHHLTRGSGIIAPRGEPVETQNTGNAQGAAAAGQKQKEKEKRKRYEESSDGDDEDDSAFRPKRIRVKGPPSPPLVPAPPPPPVLDDDSSSESDDGFEDVVRSLCGEGLAEGRINRGAK
ncbi:hypothetical protein GGS26DRAFT_588137 [Hypomontagnella submonticulosa]|nr:hypothetical protein GGS26DRAFT_588137 [Hypomontagnella submonticulosa]